MAPDANPCEVKTRNGGNRVVWLGMLLTAILSVSGAAVTYGQLEEKVQGVRAQVQATVPRQELEKQLKVLDSIVPRSEVNSKFETLKTNIARIERDIDEIKNEMRENNAHIIRKLDELQWSWREDYRGGGRQ